MENKIKKYLVGGAVRDFLLGRECHDKDYVVVGSTPEQMLSLGYKQVGAEFPVFLHPETGEEYALARKEISTGDGYQDFKFYFGPDVTLREDLERRDFTINALAMDLETNEIIDYFNGQTHLKHKLIERVNPEHFIEDPLRVLRGIRFSCQLDGFVIGEYTLRLMTDMVQKGMLEHLTPERIWKEIEKALQTTDFDLFIHYLDVIGALKIIFPEVYSLKNVPEKEEYHPEKNAYKHLILTLRQVYHRFDCNGLLLEKEMDKHEIALVNFGLLCHDLGKNLTQECWPAHHGHDILGLDLVDELCDRLKVPNGYRDFGKLSCKYHMKFYEFLKSNVKTQYDMLKEITNFKNWEPIKLLYKLHVCDLYGREGHVSEERTETCWNVLERIKTIYNIMYGITLKDLPKEVQENLFRFKGEKFGKLYRDAMISYLKHGLHKSSEKVKK